VIKSRKNLDHCIKNFISTKKAKVKMRELYTFAIICIIVKCGNAPIHNTPQLPIPLRCHVGLLVCFYDVSVAARAPTAASRDPQQTPVRGG